MIQTKWLYFSPVIDADTWTYLSEREEILEREENDYAYDNELDDSEMDHGDAND